MNVLVVTDAYPPEIRSASHLMQELAEELISRSHHVTILTGYPAYNLDETSRGSEFEEFSMEDQIAVIRVKTPPHHNVNFLLRGVSQVIMPYLFMRALKKHIVAPPDIVVVYSPPLTLARVGRTLRQRHAARFILNVQDIFPQNAIDLGALRNRSLRAYFERMERRAYSDADIVTVHSEGNREFIVNSGQLEEGSKLRVLHNWIDVQSIEAASTDVDYRKRFGLDGKFIFLFAGVIGPSQGLDLLISIAREVSDYTDIVFLIVGDGMERRRLEASVESQGLENVMFRPFVSKAEYGSLVRSVDVGVVCLAAKNKTPVVPGKILGYMAASLPVLAFLNKESDGHALIEAAQCGSSEVSDGPVALLAGTTLELCRKGRDLKRFGKNGHDYVVKSFSKEICIDTLEKFFSA